MDIEETLRPFPNKDTMICVSFAGQAGNFGATVMNGAARMLGLNFIYKPISVTDIRAAVAAIKALGICGAGVTMPFKKAAAELVDELCGAAIKTQAINTIINKSGFFVGYNTDYVAAKKVLEQHKHKPLTILGNGGLAHAVLAASKDIGIKNVWLIHRENWHDILETTVGVVFNCTPVKRANIPLHPNVEFIDCDVTTPTGKTLALLQAAEQFKLYTGVAFPWSERAILEGKVPC
jgi:shikimate dehydrogenase